MVGAINAGKRAALAIDERLSGEGFDAAAIELAAGPGIAAAIAAGNIALCPSTRAGQARSVPGPQSINMQFFRKEPRAESRIVLERLNLEFR